MMAYYRRLISEDRATRAAAARAWATWEGATSLLRTNPAYVAKFDDPDYAAAFARIEAHYFVNRGFMDSDGQLLRDVEAHPPHPGGDRSGPLRRGVPDAQRLGPAPRLAGSRAAHRAGGGSLGLRTGDHARTGRGCRSHAAAFAHQPLAVR